MIVTYDESIHIKRVKPKRGKRNTEQIFLFDKETDELVAIQCNVCGQVKSMDGFRKPNKHGKMNHYQCNECESLRKKEEAGYNTGKVYIYTIPFFDNSIYVGQTKGLKGRMAVHISDLKRGVHCDEILKYYSERPDETVECFNRYKIVKTFDINTPEDIVAEYEYELQISLHKKGFNVLGRQTGDPKFLQYLIKTKRIKNILDYIE